MEIVLSAIADWLYRIFRKRPLLRFIVVTAIIGLCLVLAYIEWFVWLGR